MTSGVTHPREELISDLRDSFKTVAVRRNKAARNLRPPRASGLLGLGLWLGSWRALWLGSWRATPKEHLHLRLCNLPVLVGIDPLENFCMGRLELLERQSPISISIH